MDRNKTFALVTNKLQQLKDDCPKELDVSFDLVKLYKFYMDLSKDHTFSLKKSYQIKDLNIESKQRDDKKNAQLVKKFKNSLENYVKDLQKKVDISYDQVTYYYLLKNIIILDLSSVVSLGFSLQKHDVNQLRVSNDFFKIVFHPENKLERIRSENNLVFMLFLDIEKISRFNFYQIYDLLSVKDSNIAFNVFFYSNNSVLNEDDIVNYANHYIKDFPLKAQISEDIGEVMNFYYIRNLSQFKINNLIDFTGKHILYVTNESLRVIEILPEESIKINLNREKLSQYLLYLRNRKTSDEDFHQQELITKMSQDDEKLEFHNIGLETLEKKKLVDKEEISIRNLNEDSNVDYESDLNLISKNKIKQLKAFLQTYKSKHLLNFHHDDQKVKNLNFIEITYEKVTNFSDFHTYKSDNKTPSVFFALNNKNKYVIESLKKGMEAKSLLKSVKVVGYYYSSSFIINIFLKMFRRIRKIMDNSLISKLRVYIVKKYEFLKQGGLIKHINITNKMKFDPNDIEKYKKMLKYVKDIKGFFSSKIISRFNYNYNIHLKLFPTPRVDEYFYFPQSVKFFKLCENKGIQFVTEINYTYHFYQKGKPLVVLVINLIGSRYIPEECLKFLENIIGNMKVTCLFIGEENEVKTILSYHYSSFSVLEHENVEFILLDHDKNDKNNSRIAELYSHIYDTKFCSYTPYGNTKERNSNFNIYFIVDERVLFITKELDRMERKIIEYQKTNNRVLFKKEFYSYVDCERFTEKNLKKSLKDLCRSIDNFLFVKKCRFEFSYESHLLVSQDFKEMLSKRVKKPKLVLNFHELDLPVVNKMVQETIFNVLPQEDVLIEHTIKSSKLITTASSDECHICRAILLERDSHYYCGVCKFHYCSSCGNADHPHSIYFPTTNVKKNLVTYLFGKVFTEIKLKGDESCYNCCSIF